MDAYSPIPIEELNEALGLRRTRLPQLVLLGGILGGLGGFSLEYLVVGDRLPDEHRRPAAQQLAAVHSGDVRDDGARRGADVLRRHVGAQQAAAAVSPGVQRAGVRARVDRSLLPRASRRPIPRSSATTTRTFLEGLHPVGVSEVAP